MKKRQPWVSVDAMAQSTHEKWLKDAPRNYSPFNMPWPELTADQRTQISRQARNVLDLCAAAGHRIPFIDEYMPPGPGDFRWHDPQTRNCDACNTPRSTEDTCQAPIRHDQQ